MDGGGLFAEKFFSARIDGVRNSHCKMNHFNVYVPINSSPQEALRIQKKI